MTARAALRRLINRVLLFGAFVSVLLWSAPNVLDPGSTPGGGATGLFIRLIPALVSAVGVYVSARMIVNATRRLLRIVFS